MDGGQAQLHPDGQDDGGQHQDQAGHLDQAAQAQHQDVEQDQNDDLVAGNGEQTGSDHGGDAQVGQQIGECAGHTQQDQHLAQSFNNVCKDVGDVTELEALVDEQADAQRPHNGSSSGLGGGKDTGDNADDHEHHSQHAPDGVEERLDAVLQVELAGDRDVHLLGVVVGVDHQHDAQHSAGHVAGHEQLADGNGGDTGSSQREDDHVLRRGNQNAFNGGCHGQAGRELAVIALLFHHLDLDGAQRGTVGRRRTGDAAKEEGGHHVDHGSTAMHPADQFL